MTNLPKPLAAYSERDEQRRLLDHPEVARSLKRLLQDLPEAGSHPPNVGRLQEAIVGRGPLSGSGRKRLARSAPKGGLVSWQARLVISHINSHLDSRLRTRDLAQLINLSCFHFCRVFRVNFGESPHRYITQRRIERAQGLMRTTTLSLGQIAIDCGFADQPHFTKLFRRSAGMSPGEWRRRRSVEAANP